MRTKHRNILLLFLVFLLLSVLLIQLLERKWENDLASTLGEQVQVSTIEINLLANQIQLSEVKLQLEEVQVLVEEIRLSGMKIFPWLLDEEIGIKKLSFSSTEMTYFQAHEDTLKTSTKLDHLITIDEVVFESTRFRMERNASESFSANLPVLSFGGVQIDEQSLESRIPFRYEDYFLQADSLKATLDPRHDLYLSKIKIDNGWLLAEGLRVEPRYGKRAFQEHIPHELDRYELKIAEIEMDNLKVGFQNDTLLLQNPKLRINKAELEVYRDKLQADDPSKKLLYSAQLRELPLRLDFGQVAVLDSRIVYQERANADRNPLHVEFSALNGTILNLKNRPLNQKVLPETRVEVKAQFMNEAPLEVNWRFNIADQTDNFRISGDFGELSSNGINNFLEPAMNLRSKGGLSYMAFNFQGDDDRATGEMQLRYQDFSIEVLKEDGTEKRGLLSAITNIFVNSSAEGKDVRLPNLEVSRDKEKSFWNFLWRCIREGAIDSFL